VVNYMAKTKSVLRGRVNSIIDIRRKEIPGLQLELVRLAKLLGNGTFRSVERPGYVLSIADQSVGGWRTDWQQVARELARQLGMSEMDLEILSRGYKSYVYPGKMDKKIRISKDTAKGKTKGVTV
jgi:hypothetical protein